MENLRGDVKPEDMMTDEHRRIESQQFGDSDSVPTLTEESEAWKTLCEEFPELRETKLSDSNENKHIAFFDLVTGKEGEVKPTIYLPSDNLPVKKMLLPREDFQQRISEMLGLNLGQVTERVMKLFALLHEAGHADDYIENYQSQFKKPREVWLNENRNRLSNLPIAGYPPDVLKELHENGQFDFVASRYPALKGKSFEEILKLQIDAYRALPGEKIADDFATAFLRAHPELLN